MYFIPKHFVRLYKSYTPNIQNSMEIPNETLEAIRNELPYGSQVEIAKKAGYSDQYVSDFLNGKVKINNDNINILKEAQKKIREKREADEVAKATIEAAKNMINEKP